MAPASSAKLAAIRVAPGGLDAKLVLSSTKVLDEGVTGDDHRRSLVGLQAAHRPKPCLEASVIGLDAVVGVLLDVVEGTGDELSMTPT